MDHRENDYADFVDELNDDLGVMVDLERAITCFGNEGTCMEDTIADATIQGTVEIIVRGESYLLINKHSGSKVWINQRTGSHAIFVGMLQKAIQRVINPHLDPESYWAHEFAMQKDA